MTFIGKLLAFCVPCPLGTGDWKWCKGESVFDFHTVKRSATLGDSKVMMHSPLTEKGSASKRDFLRRNLPIISHHSSIWNFFFPIESKIVLVFFCGMSSGTHCCLESFFFLQTPFKQGSVLLSFCVGLCVCLLSSFICSLSPSLLQFPSPFSLSLFPSSSAHSGQSSL